jgi:hypothetical protein
MCGSSHFLVCMHKAYCSDFSHCLHAQGILRAGVTAVCLVHANLGPHCLPLPGLWVLASGGCLRVVGAAHGSARISSSCDRLSLLGWGELLYCMISMALSTWVDSPDPIGYAVLLLAGGLFGCFSLS